MASETFDWHQNVPIHIGYTGTVREILFPRGSFRFEICGGQGAPNIPAYPGGFGGKSVGVLHLKESRPLFIRIGGHPSGQEGGWNGGGHGYNTGHPYSYGGGGASDVSLYGGYLDYYHLYSRLIVAGGGGGSCVPTSGGSSIYRRGGQGGGVYGGDGNGDHRGLGAGPNYPGRYILNQYGQSPGSFGLGGSPGYHSGESMGAGGGGWYGGSSAGGLNENGSGGGGSGYIFTESQKMYYPQGCLLSDDFLLEEPKIYDATNEGAGFIVLTPLQLFDDKDFRKNTNIYKDVNNALSDWRDIV